MIVRRTVNSMRLTGNLIGMSYSTGSTNVDIARAVGFTENQATDSVGLDLTPSGTAPIPFTGGSL